MLQNMSSLVPSLTVRVKEERAGFRFAGKFWVQHRLKGPQNVHLAVSQKTPDHAPPHHSLTLCLKAVGSQVVTGMHISDRSLSIQEAAACSCTEGRPIIMTASALAW